METGSWIPYSLIGPNSSCSIGWGSGCRIGNYIAIIGGHKSFSVELMPIGYGVNKHHTWIKCPSQLPHISHEINHNSITNNDSHSIILVGGIVDGKRTSGVYCGILTNLNKNVLTLFGLGV